MFGLFGCCLISLFYIKPQPIINGLKDLTVVLYRYSTSNHNTDTDVMSRVTVVLYRYSTSNHNQRINFIRNAKLSYIVILHQTTTCDVSKLLTLSCLISLFYIKPQPYLHVLQLRTCCLISLFYIKPQPPYLNTLARKCCLISLFYIKPQLRIITG